MVRRLKTAAAANVTAVQFEPGVDRQIFDSQWHQLEDEAHTAPAEALPELADLMEQVIVEDGYDLSDPVARTGEEREVVAEYLAAREVADRVERGEEVDPGDVASAFNSLRALHDHFLESDASDL